MRRVSGLLARPAFHPDDLHPDAVSAIALFPPVAAGLILFRLPAAEVMGVGLAIGAAVHLVARLLRQPLRSSPAVVGLVAAGLCGPAAPLWWPAGAAGLAALLEVARGRGRFDLPLHTGLFAFAAITIAARGETAAYLVPGGRPFPEPIRLWHDFFPSGAAPIEAVRLYVGNVAGPAMATSLLAVTIGVVWLWYARRLEVVLPLAMLAGGVAVCLYERWNLGYHLVSGPLWLAGCYALADVRLLPRPRLLALLLGLAAGVAGFGLPMRGFGIEYCVAALAGLQAVIALLVGSLALVRRRLRRRPAGDSGEPATRTRPGRPATQAK